MSTKLGFQYRKYSTIGLIASIILLLIGLAVIGSAAERTVRIPAYNMVDISGTVAQAFQGLALVIIGSSLMIISIWIRIKSFEL